MRLPIRPPRCQGMATSALSSMDKAAQDRREKLEAINAYLRYKRVPHNLRRRLNDYYDYLYSCLQGIDESEILAKLPDSLRRQLHISLNRKVPLRAPHRLEPRAPNASPNRNPSLRPRAHPSPQRALAPTAAASYQHVMVRNVCSSSPTCRSSSSATSSASSRSSTASSRASSCRATLSSGRAPTRRRARLPRPPTFPSRAGPQSVPLGRA